MIKKLTKHGNSYAMVIEKPILELLRVSPDTPFEVTSDGQCLVLTPVRDAEAEKKFQQALENVHTRFGRAMKRLATDGEAAPTAPASESEQEDRVRAARKDIHEKYGEVFKKLAE